MSRCTLILTGFELDLSSPEGRNAARHFVQDTAEKVGAKDALFRYDVNGPNVQTLDLRRFEEGGETPEPVVLPAEHIYPDTNELTVDEIEAEVLGIVDAEELDLWLSAEKSGKNRVGAVKAIEARIAELTEGGDPASADQPRTGG